MTKRTGSNGTKGKITVDSGAYANPKPSTPRGKKRAACKAEMKLNRKPTADELRGYNSK